MFVYFCERVSSATSIGIIEYGITSDLEAAHKWVHLVAAKTWAKSRAKFKPLWEKQSEDPAYQEMDKAIREENVEHILANWKVLLLEDFSVKKMPVRTVNDFNIEEIIR